MRLISSDTNIWLDFNTIAKLDLPFKLPYTYIMYKETLREEIISPPSLLSDLQDYGLQGVELTTEEFYYAAELSEKYVKLSGYDRTALAIAKMRNIPLLTGDNPLRLAAIHEGVEVFGTIGLLDRLYEGKHICRKEYLYCMEEFLRHKERRLPAEELQKRIDAINERR